METPSNILRRSIFTFLHKYHYFTTIAAFLAFPFAASTLLLQSLLPSQIPIIHSLLPSSSILFSILHTKLYHTIAISVLAFPSTLSSFLFCKASVIHALMTTNQECPSFSCLFKLHIPLIHTQICNSLFTLSSLFIAFNLADYGLGLSSLVFSAIGALVFSLICNLALILSATQKRGGFTALLKACVLIKTRIATALSLALPINAAMAAVEALFQYRVVRAYHDDGVFSAALEGLFIVYLYALLIVLDTIVAYFFFTARQEHKDGRKKIAQDQSLACSCRSIKIVEDLP